MMHWGISPMPRVVPALSIAGTNRTMSENVEAGPVLLTPHWTARRLPELDLIRQRLRQVFPEGVDGRSWAIAERAARSLYVFLYTFAVEDVTENRLRPAMVITMSDEQAARTSPDERWQWLREAQRPRRTAVVVGRWYAENTRESIRDETFRVWKEYGAILEDAVPTTSSRPRYRLARDFAELFSPQLRGVQLNEAITAWQARHLTHAARARMALLAQQSTSSAGAQVVFPDGSTRVLAAGPSTPLLKAVVESFAPTFLYQPIVLLVTESRRRLAYEDAEQLRRIGLQPDPRVMPDLLLADVGVPNGDLRLVFLECVATAGAMTQERRSALRNWLASSNLDRIEAVFGTVFRDRADQVFRRLVGELVWESFVVQAPTRLP
jgi:hypothetical protein